MDEYSITAGSKFETIPGYVIVQTGIYKSNELVPVALETAPLEAIGSFLCADILGINTEQPNNSNTILTKYQFRNRFTSQEKYRCDTFNASFENNLNLSDELKVIIRSALKDFEVCEEIDLTNSDIHKMLNLYEQLGLLDAPGRALEIGAI